MTARGLLLLGLTMLVAWAGASESYMRLRKTHGIEQSAGVAALETLLGTRVFEVRGVVNGFVRAGGNTILLLRGTDGGDIHVSTTDPPQWLMGGETAARLIVRATRGSELSMLRAELLAAAPEAEIARIEAQRNAARAAAQSRTRPASRTSRRPTPLPGTIPNRDWQVPASSATPLYEAAIRRINPRLSVAEARRIATGIVGFSIQYGVDARLVMAMVMVESGFNPNATSRKGAMGLGQLMPGTARGLGVRNPYDSLDNLNGAVRMIRGHLEKYQAKTGDSFEALVLMLAAYNAGSGAVRRHGGVPPFRETQNYVRKVITLYRQFAGE